MKQDELLQPSSQNPPAAFTQRLIAWQSQHGRHDLPWQKTRDAYRIWLSEIMLQQTQVGTVIPYYERFLKRFPTIHLLAAASIDEVLELWSGLGYYARARNLHRCACILVQTRDGEFPKEAEQINLLPGIGRSTAAAIAVFAFGARAAIFDGNVKRVLARCFGIEGLADSKKAQEAWWSLAESLLPAQKIEGYTQGLMDLGATCCKRSKPLCTTCPMGDICIARREERQASLPTAKAKKGLTKRVCSMLLISDGERILLERRPASGIWGGLLSLPELTNTAETAGAAGTGAAAALDSNTQGMLERFLEHHGCALSELTLLPVLQHRFTHFQLNIYPLLCRVNAKAHRVNEAGYSWCSRAALGSAALPTPVRKIVQDYFLAPPQIAPN
ncbi:MAG: A/G-specific adenine glycosylase [Pseudomonadota bacterium]